MAELCSDRKTEDALDFIDQSLEEGMPDMDKEMIDALQIFRPMVFRRREWVRGTDNEPKFTANR